MARPFRSVSAERWAEAKELVDTVHLASELILARHREVATSGFCTQDRYVTDADDARALMIDALERAPDLLAGAFEVAVPAAVIGTIEEALHSRVGQRPTVADHLARRPKGNEVLECLTRAMESGRTRTHEVFVGYPFPFLPPERRRGSRDRSAGLA